MAEGIIGRAAKKLEQALGIPRPWELYPPASVRYQVATGEGSLIERARKGLAQSLGRYATNMANPSGGFDLPKYGEDYRIKDILQDSAPWLRPEYYGEKDPSSWYAGPMQVDNEQLSRELFDLQPRIPIEKSGLVKTGPKQYTIKEESAMKPVAREGGLYYNALLGKYKVAQNPATKALEYSDVWDISSPVGPVKVKNPYGDEDYAPDYEQEGSLLSHMIRELVNPMLSPATVKGKVKRPTE